MGEGKVPGEEEEVERGKDMRTKDTNVEVMYWTRVQKLGMKQNPPGLKSVILMYQDALPYCSPNLDQPEGFRRNRSRRILH